MLAIVLQEVLWSIRWSYSTTLSLPYTNVKWHADPWPTVASKPIRLSTNFVTLIPCQTLVELWVISMEHLQWAWHASRERLPLRTPGSVFLFGTCLCSICWYQIFRICKVFSRLFTLNTPWFFSILLFSCTLMYRSAKVDMQRIPWDGAKRQFFAILLTVLSRYSNGRIIGHFNVEKRYDQTGMLFCHCLVTQLYHLKIFQMSLNVIFIQLLYNCKVIFACSCPRLHGCFGDWVCGSSKTGKPHQFDDYNYSILLS